MLAGLRSDEGLTGAGGSGSKMVCSHGCWQEALLSSSPWGPLLRCYLSVLMTWWLVIQETEAEATMPFMTLLQKSHTVLCNLRYWSHSESWFKAGRAYSRARGLVGEDPVGRKSVFGDWTVTASWNIRAERVLRDHLFQHPHSIAEENKGQQH